MQKKKTKKLIKKKSKVEEKTNFIKFQDAFKNKNEDEDEEEEKTNFIKLQDAYKNKNEEVSKKKVENKTNLKDFSSKNKIQDDDECDDDEKTMILRDNKKKNEKELEDLTLSLKPFKKKK